MPLFECTQCGAVENTAISNYWVRVHLDQKPALCSECDPDIGKWHGNFPKVTVDKYLAKFPGEKIEYLASKQR